MKPVSAFFVSCACLLLFTASSFAAVIPVDLTDFYVENAVTVAVDGSSALLKENVEYWAYLGNVPEYGDPGLAVPENVLSLDFCLDFILADSNSDEFYVILFNGVSGEMIGTDYLLDNSFKGKLSWDLSALDPDVTLLGLEFQLDTYDELFESTATISHLAFVTGDAAPVPEPGTFLLLGAGLAGLVVYRRKK